MARRRFVSSVNKRPVVKDAHPLIRCGGGRRRPVHPSAAVRVRPRVRCRERNDDDARGKISKANTGGGEGKGERKRSLKLSGAKNGDMHLYLHTVLGGWTPLDAGLHPRLIFRTTGGRCPHEYSCILVSKLQRKFTLSQKQVVV